MQLHASHPRLRFEHWTCFPILHLCAHNTVPWFVFVLGPDRSCKLIPALHGIVLILSLRLASSRAPPCITWRQTQRARKASPSSQIARRHVFRLFTIRMLSQCVASDELEKQMYKALQTNSSMILRRERRHRDGRLEWDGSWGGHLRRRWRRGRPARERGVLGAEGHV